VTLDLIGTAIEQFEAIRLWLDCNSFQSVTESDAMVEIWQKGVEVHLIAMQEEEGTRH